MTITFLQEAGRPVDGAPAADDAAEGPAAEADPTDAAADGPPAADDAAEGPAAEAEPADDAPRADVP